VPKDPVIHKKGRRTIEHYAGFGQYVRLPVPMCVTPSFVWTKKPQMYQHRLWKFVTCKNCLRMRKKDDLPAPPQACT